MKNILKLWYVLLIVFLIFVSCENSTKSKNDNEIYGKWQCATHLLYESNKIDGPWSDPYNIFDNNESLSWNIKKNNTIESILDNTAPEIYNILEISDDSLKVSVNDKISDMSYIVNENKLIIEQIVYYDSVSTYDKFITTFEPID